MRLDVVFDTVCPWCYIGTRRLRRALTLRPGLHADIRWRPFLLNPDMPSAGLDRQVYLERKFGSTYRIQRMHNAAVQAGEAEGIPFDFDAIERMPNSLSSHRLIQWAEGSGRQGELVEALFQAFFLKGQDIGRISVLCEIVEACGLPSGEAEAYLNSLVGIGVIEADYTRIHRLGVTGVPCFILNDSYALSGAQEPDILARLMDVVRETELEPASG